MNETLKKSKKTKNAKNKVNDESLVKLKGLGLFDHIKHIQKVQDPNYFDTLTAADKKSFNHFMILRGLSMNSELVDTVAMLYRYFDVIPSLQFYKLLIDFIPKENPRVFHPWIKASKNPYSKHLIELVARKYEVSQKKATDYIRIFSSTEKGIEDLVNICRGFALTDKEIESLMTDGDSQ